MDENEMKKKPSLAAIFADFLVGAGSRILLAHAFPGSDVWEDWVPFEEIPIQEYLESLPKQPGPVDPILTDPLPEKWANAPVANLLPPVADLGRVFHFRAAAISTMIGVDVALLKDWLTGAAVPQGESRKRLAMLGALYEQLAHHFDGKPLKEFYAWMEMGLEALGGRSPAQALLDGNAAAVMWLLVIRSMGEERQGQRENLARPIESILQVACAVSWASSFFEKPSVNLEKTIRIIPC